MIKIWILFIVYLCENVRASNDWDYLMYSQRWPITACNEWKEQKPANTCNLPKDRTLWTVHGIWPTKIGTDGPYFCNSAVHFHPEDVDPLIDDLKARWVNVEANTKAYSFWDHEWKKHGTCSVNLPQLNSVYNFFYRGLLWNKQFALSQILQQQKIVPQSQGYSIETIYAAIRNHTQKLPIIQCIVDPQTKQSLISEIRICFSKNLDVIDCDSKNPIHLPNGDTILSNCNAKKPVMYLGDVSGSEWENEIRDDERLTVAEDEDMDYELEKRMQEYYKRRNRLVNLYNFFKFLIWATL